ncbi:MAG: DUF4326 domain-containing protein [Anaerolineae bacterium]|nr:DUF4326 domain-containing protein [Anaerolineae bacterium]
MAGERVKVLNKKKDKIPKGAVYVGRPSIYGNPFPLRKGRSREEVIEKFRLYFEERAKSDLVFMAALKKIVDAPTLVCFCAPERCHAEVIRDHLLKLREEK